MEPKLFENELWTYFEAYNCSKSIFDYFAVLRFLAKNPHFLQKMPKFMQLQEWIKIDLDHVWHF